MCTDTIRKTLLESCQEKENIGAIKMGYNLFISHSWSHSDKYTGLIDLLDEQIRFCYKDYSVPRTDPLFIQAKTDIGYKRVLKQKIRDQMRYASVVIILAGVYASYSDSIDMEIEIALELGKPILAVEYWGSERSSTRVISNADDVVKWNSKSIVTAIRALAKWE